jgi:hypothetical protein
MKGMKQLMVAGLFVFASTTGMATDTTVATTKTAMDARWICTTNASRSSVEADKAADDKMAQTAASSVDAYAFAASNCRDCTKITCEAQSN